MYSALVRGIWLEIAYEHVKGHKGVKHVHDQLPVSLLGKCHLIKLSQNMKELCVDDNSLAKITVPAMAKIPI